MAPRSLLLSFVLGRKSKTSLNARAGGAACRALPIGSPNYPPASQAGSPGGKRHGAKGWGARGASLHNLRWAGGCLTVETGPAGEGAAAGDRRREPEGDRERRAPVCPGELF